MATLGAAAGVSLLAGVVLARGKPEPSRKGGHGKPEHGHDHKTDKRHADKHEPERPKTPPSLRVESFDLRIGRAVVLVGGVTRPPDGRVFSFHDDRDRHYIALHAECTPAPDVTALPDAGARAGASPSETMRCALDVPSTYLVRGQVVSVTVHLRGSEVRADASEVRALYAAARDAAPPRADYAPLPTSTVGLPGAALALLRGDGGLPDGAVYSGPRDGGVPSGAEGAVPESDPNEDADEDEDEN